MIEARTIATRTHGRYLVDARDATSGTLIGFHGYQEPAEANLRALRRVVGERPMRLASIQGLHRFYSRSNEVVASWMTRQDREVAIADNIDYVAATIAAIAEEFGAIRPIFYVGFSQGAAMAYRAAAFVRQPCDGLIILGGDLPPDVAAAASTLPTILVGRGSEDTWYSASKAADDIALLRGAGVEVTEHVFEGGHGWAEGFVKGAARFIDEHGSITNHRMT